MKKISLIFLTFIFCFQLHASKIYSSDAMVLNAGKSTALAGGKTNTRKDVDEPISALSPIKIPGLTNGASYIPALSAVNAVGLSVNSTAITASPVLDGPVCNAYTNKSTGNGLGNAQVNGVYVIGTTFYAATEGGLSISTDGGSTFTNKTTTHSLGSNTVYGVYAIGTTVYAATTGGLSISTDGGSTFTNKTTTDGLGSNIVNGVYVIGSTVYAATNGGLSISTDGGNIFTNKIIGFSYFVNGVYVIGSNVYAATNGGLAISTDGGTSFTVKTTGNGLGNNLLTGVYAIGSTVYAATEGGLSISINGGTTFTNKTTTDGLGWNMVKGVYVIGSTVYAATINGLSISTDGGTSFTNKTTANGLGSTVVYGVYASGSTIYAATQSGLSFCATVPSAPSSLSATAGDGQVQLNFTAGADGGTPITNYEYRVNGGTTWTPLNPADATSPVTISGLTNGASYTLALRAVNVVGVSVASASVTANLVGDASTLTIDPIANQTFTGSDLTPAIVVKDGATTLTLGTHYSVAYSNNTNVGTATVTVTGLGFYTGTKTQTFSIARPTMSIVSGNNQSGAVNQALADSPILKVINPDGTPAANVSLTVTASNGQINLPVLSNVSAVYTIGGSEINNSVIKALQFTTGGTSITLEEVAVVLNSINLLTHPYPYTGEVEAAIYTVVNANPGVQIGSSGLQSVLLSATGTWKNLVFSSPIELSPNTSYALVLKSNATGVKWANVDPVNIPPTGLVSFLNARSFYNSTWNSVQLNNNNPVSEGNGFILKGATPLSTSQTLVTNANGTVGLGSWVLGDRAGTQELVVTNASLSGSPLTITATATAVVPSAPTNLSYTPGNGQVVLSFTPAYDGGSAITNYEYSLDNGSAWAPLSPVDVSSPITISGLSDGVTYPLRIRAVNTAGSGVASAAINVIALIPLSYQSITIDAIASQTYTGSAITPTVVVKDGATTLTETTAYTVAYSSNTNVGTATVTITGTGNYSGTKAQTFGIVAKAASTLTIDAIGSQTYTGSQITPAIVVKDGGTTLVETTAYTVAYSNNTNVGTATVTITGTGNYTGTKTQTFSIVAKAASTLTIEVIANQTYTGSAITPSVVVKDGSTTLALGTDYTVAYTSNTNVGTATVTITGTGNYTGTKTQTFSIVAKAASTLTIEAIANQTYTVSAITPTVVVKDGSTTLTLGTDYTVAYSNNTNVGTATATVTGMGVYTGTKTQTFAIVSKAVSTLTIDSISNQTYTGAAISPTVVVRDGSTTLTLSTNYTVAYTSNTNAGTARVTITGTGNYSGANPQTFAILPKAVILQANNASKIFGDANPSLSFSYSGLVAGDTEIDQVPTISTTASTTSGVGNYPITLTGGSDPNYTLTLLEGVLEVIPAPLSLTVNAVTKIYGQADPVYTYSLLGLKGSDTEAVLGGAFSREAGEDPGTYRINQGSRSAGANYTLTVTGASLQILKAKVSSVAQLALVTTAWSKEAALPATVKVLAAHGQDFQVEVKWDKSTLNLLARGTYSLTGTLILPAGIENPNQVFAKIQVQVFPKPAPRDVTITNNTFVGSTTQFFISVGDFKINDPVDNIHVVSLLGKGYDNTYFQIKDNILFWNSAERAAGKTTFSIVVRVTDRDGNTLDKFFEIKRTRPDFSTVTIFNTFTPNADRFNDTWGVPEVRFYEGARISVYDRGGSRLFYTENPDVRWDGTYDGKEMPVGTYFWIIEIGETGEIRKGMLNVIRK